MSSVSQDGACIVYYCSGHGYGHATRVSAFARHILSLEGGYRPRVYLVSSAPEHVFSDSISCGALYRYAEIDPVIVQPLAYRVDRDRSVAVLKSFLSKKADLLEREKEWLFKIKATAVLSDAAFLGCLAAKAAAIPSVLITNFSFDSVYSYLSTSILDEPQVGLQPGGFDSLMPDNPIPPSELEPLVDEIYSGYRCADMLVLLPGHIPIPSFFAFPPLPSPAWIDAETVRMQQRIVDAFHEECTLLPPVPFPASSFTIPRRVVPAPLLVRPANEGSYTQEGKSRILSGLGVPSERHGAGTKVLIVSFGGQNFFQPSRSRSGSHTQSCNAGRDTLSAQSGLSYQGECNHQSSGSSDRDLAPTARLATESHIWVPGAPPAYKALGSPTVPHIPTFNTIPPTPTLGTEPAYFDLQVDPNEPRLLPDETWIAIVCGVSKEQWLTQGEVELPEGFYVAPKDVYMPDLTAIGDVLLGKLGYGTTSECVDACTPFVYVSRPLFVEEHGLRLLLERDGVGVELPRQLYEAGDWAPAIIEAWTKGKVLKDRKRSQQARGIGIGTRDKEGRELAKTVLDWATDWSSKVKERIQVDDNHLASIQS